MTAEASHFFAISQFRVRDPSSVAALGGVSEQCLRGTIYCVRCLV